MNRTKRKVNQKIDIASKLKIEIHVKFIRNKKNYI